MSVPGPVPDRIIIKELRLRGVVGADSWERLKQQPLVVSICLDSDTAGAGKTDSLSRSVNYSTVAKFVQDIVEARGPHKSAATLAGDLAWRCLDHFGIDGITVRVEVPRAVLHAGSAGVEVTRRRGRSEPLLDCYFLKDLRVSTIIGVNPWEREEKQVVSISVEAFAKAAEQSGEHHAAARFRRIEQVIVDQVAKSAYLTIEALVSSIAGICLERLDLARILVRVEKPSALPFAAAAAVEIVRESDSGRGRPSRAAVADGQHVAHVALGSNIGDRVRHIADVVELLERRGCRILDTSFLYETPAMYVTEQPSFINAVCKIATALTPSELLACVKSIETELGRTPTVRNGPRVIDLDILFYDALEVKEDNLVIPHPLMQEREFVLRPLCDIARDLEHPSLYTTCGWLLRLVPHTAPDESIARVLPIGGRMWTGKDGPYVMGILNVTPDSFSDGGSFNALDAAVDRALQMVEEGAAIVDVGGMSTRPNAEEISEEEELERVVPVIRELRRRDLKAPISIDTYRSRVARAAIEAGADIINDVSAGDLDPDMLSTAAELGVPICLMHMRGNPRTMTTLTAYDGEDVVAGVAKELADKVRKALQAGVRRWNIILDPGLGFAKTAEQNVELLRRLAELKREGSGLEGFPLLVGASRKGFIGKLQNEPDPKKRTQGTAAACYAAMAGGAEILRVHDVKEISEMVRVARHFLPGSHAT
ncbi:Dihydropteroate synthase-like protein [Hyaloraphidium curvatum]|nr:Dihydropteroate synthase-like protein [Hyaloraphidium curvatum]